MMNTNQEVNLNVKQGMPWRWKFLGWSGIGLFFISCIYHRADIIRTSARPGNGTSLRTIPVPSVTPPKLTELLDIHAKHPSSKLEYSLKPVWTGEKIVVKVIIGEYGDKKVEEVEINPSEFCPPSIMNARNETSTAFKGFVFYTTQVAAIPHSAFNLTSDLSKMKVYLGTTCTEETFGRNELTPKELAAIEAQKKLEEAKDAWNKSKIKMEDLKHKLRPKRQAQ